MMATKNQMSSTEAVLAELENIKRLLIYDLMRKGASQAEVAAALNVNQSSISRMFPQKGKRSK